MLCPEVWNFPAPKTITSDKRNLGLENVQEIVNMNYFYKSVVITIPDELQTPNLIAEAVADSVYYKITDCPLEVFMKTNFVENFVKNGKLYCLSAGRDCTIDNCAAITPDGVLTLHIPDYIFQCIGLEGVKRPHHFYETKIDLKNNTQLEKAALCITKLEKFDFILHWEPPDQDICPSSIAKYFYEQNLKVTAMNQEVKRLSPHISDIPGTDSEPSELMEWIGMLALECELIPKYDYVSSYTPPESDHPIKSTRISIMILKGFFTPETLNELCKQISSYVNSREMNNYWAALSLTSQTDCLWRWNSRTPSIFQSQDSSTTIFFSKKSNILFTQGEVQ